LEIGQIFAEIGISQDLVAKALTALQKHSQNDILYDPKRVTSIPQDSLQKANSIFEWTRLPFDCDTPMDEFKRIYYNN